ncbi:hypothetical protein D3C81_1424920 [compost metagenome]
MDLSLVGITPVGSGGNTVALDLQPQVQVMAERVLNKPGRVGEVPAVLERASLNLVLDDVHQARGMLPVGRCVAARHELPAQLAIETKIHPYRIAPGFYAFCHVRTHAMN